MALQHFKIENYNFEGQQTEKFCHQIVNTPLFGQQIGRLQRCGKRNAHFKGGITLMFRCARESDFTSVVTQITYGPALSRSENYGPVTRA